MKSIQTKFLAIIFSGLLIMAFAVGTIGVEVCHTIIHKDADLILNAVCQKDAADINSLFTRAQNVVNIMKDYAISDDNLEKAEDLKNDTFRASYKDQMEKTFSTVVSNAKGLFSYYMRFSPELMGTGTAGFWYGVDSETGVITKSTPTDILAYEETDTEHVGWYYEPIKANKAIWLEPYQNLNTEADDLMISYATPFYKDNILLGVIGIDLDHSVLLAQVAQIKVYERGTAYLAETHHPNEELHGEVAVAQAELLNGMHLVISAEYKDIQRDQRIMMWNFVLISLMIAPIFIGLTIYLTRTIIQPLKELAAAAEALADGKEYKPLKYKGSDEISALSTAFKNTSEKLTEYVNYVNALAYHDALTGVMSRTAYNEAVVLMDRKIQYESPNFALLMADLNDLKFINDTYGHDAGDELIVIISRIISETFTRSPIYRIGGDEFVVILENEDFDMHTELLQVFDKKCKEASIVIGEKKVPVSIARGIAVYHPELDKTVEDVFKHADAAMYLYKRSAKEALRKLNEKAGNE